MSNLRLLRVPEDLRNNMADWAVRIAVGLIFMLVGTEKFNDQPGSEWVRIFLQIGWGDWFRYATGVVEAVGGLAVFLPWTALLGYMLLACTMAGAALIHAFVLRDGGVAVVPMILCAILSGLAFHRYWEGN